MHLFKQLLCLYFMHWSWNNKTQMTLLELLFFSIGKIKKQKHWNCVEQTLKSIVLIEHGFHYTLPYLINFFRQSNQKVCYALPRFTPKQIVFPSIECWNIHFIDLVMFANELKGIMKLIEKLNYIQHFVK